MQTQIQKWGNSLGIRIPMPLANKLSFKQGGFVNLEISDNHLVISLELSELNMLLDKITDDNKHHEVLDDVLLVKNRGNVCS